MFRECSKGRQLCNKQKNKIKQNSKLKSLLHRSFQAEQDHMHIQYNRGQILGENMF